MSGIFGANNEKDFDGLGYIPTEDEELCCCAEVAGDCEDCPIHHPDEEDEDD